MVVLLLSIVLAHTVAAANFGIGFNLNFDYATASVIYANGTSIGIAKVEGGPSYKRMMRNQVWKMPSQDPPHARQDQLQHVATRKPQIRLQDIRDHLPPWLGGRAPDERTQLIKRMLQSLCGTAEAYTESDVHDIVTVFPGMPSPEIMKATKSATTSIGLHLPAIGHSCAPSMAIYANRWARLGHGWIDENECYHWRERLVLAVDYSRAALTGALYAEDCFGLLDGIRGFQDTNLGKDAAWSNADGTGRSGVVEALRRLLHMPVVTDEGNVLDRIHSVALSGEAGYDEHFRSILREVLQSELGTANVSAEAIYDPFLASETMVDPLYASAIGSAAICWERLEETERVKKLELR